MIRSKKTFQFLFRSKIWRSWKEEKERARDRTLLNVKFEAQLWFEKEHLADWVRPKLKNLTTVMAATTRGFQKFGCLVIFLITLISIQFWVILNVQKFGCLVIFNHLNFDSIMSNFKCPKHVGSGCGTDGRTVTSNTRGPDFESSPGQLCREFSLWWLKMTGNGPFNYDQASSWCAAV